MVKKQTRRKTTAKKTATRKTATTRKTAVKSTAKKRQPNPFKGADYVKQTATTYKVQQVVANTNGLKVKEKVVPRNAKTDRQFSALKRG